MNDSATVVVSVQARRATATFAVDTDDPAQVRQFARYALLQALRGETVTIEVVPNADDTAGAAQLAAAGSYLLL